MRLYRRAKLLVEGKADIDHLVADGIDIYYFDKPTQAVFVFKKENRYAPIKLDWKQEFVGVSQKPCVRRVGEHVYVVMKIIAALTDDTTIYLYRNGKLLNNIEVNA